MMIQLRIFSLLFCLFSGLCAAEARQNTIQIQGTDSRFELPESMEADLLRRSSNKETAEETTRWLAAQGYLDAEADSIQTDGQSLVVYVREGCRYLLEEINVLYETENGAAGLPDLPGISAKYTFTSGILEELTARWLRVLESVGFLMSEVRIDGVHKRETLCSVHINATISPGPRHVVEGLQFRGVSKNSAEYLEKITGIREGERITTALLNRGRQNLVNSGLFNDVSGGELVFVNGSPTVQYSVDEQQLNFFDGLIGFVPDESGSANISGYGDILLRNAVTDGSLLDLRFEQLEPFVTQLDIRAEQQFIGGVPAKVGAALHFTQQDSSYLVRNVELTGGYRLAPGFEILTHIRTERSSVSEASAAVDLQTPALDARANFFGLGFALKNTDRFRIPTRGYNGEVMFERGRRFINDDQVSASQQSFSQTVLRADIRGYIPLGTRQILAPRVRTMLIESEEFLITDLFRFGGAESIRGFREDQFRASAVGWGELEGRYLLDRSSYIFMFGAYGIYRRPQLINEPTDLLEIRDTLTSLGFGLAFESPLGLIKFSYAVSPNEDLANGKVHVGITAGL
ncbi:MAG: BamA/TamA family outer membrane protein [Bacteroidetes bacterium]|jgi:outer membrane protein assembly factor BamA|nr:BamA/TamA family outer membrane protein [Bacteroidota bacterium]